jgi:hypothetical protein
LAPIGTVIIVDSVAIVASFSTSPNNTITALSQTTTIRTAILVNPIAIITIFIAFIFRLKILPNPTIAATGDCTVVQTSIFVDPIAIITNFPLLNHTITTATRSTLVTLIISDLIAIITALAGT